ncbi:hypothetical protein PEP31012_01314 [Pandoraea eparura]|uniref:Uncharacterized protein n=1 Tax=Pandoraea eparura TaxID=2508291 RepID=A0A5E4TCN6_9BURK|nr:hypothetical protein PEP31012_01314 [Pandoraea eparura]
MGKRGGFRDASRARIGASEGATFLWNRVRSADPRSPGKGPVRGGLKRDVGAWRKPRPEPNPSVRHRRRLHASGDGGGHRLAGGLEQCKALGFVLRDFVERGVQVFELLLEHLPMLRQRLQEHA